MSAECSSAPVIWNWIIQSLANFKQVDSSTLVGLVKEAPAISDDLGKGAREMVSLRILESLFGSGDETTIDTDSAQNAKISFDPQEHCEDVLRKIFDETSQPMTESERKKWDIHTFIMHKRSSLPKPPLQKLKEAILEGNHPFLASLKETSKLGVRNISENVTTRVNVNFDTQTTSAKDYLASVNASNENNKFHENLSQKSGQEDHFGRNEHETSINIMENSEFVSKNTNIQPDDPVDQDGQLEPGTDKDISDDEWTDVAARKEAFMSQDSMAMADWTEISLCMKCNEGGQLLICSSDACPLRIHDTCLGSDAKLDENGSFFCPFCVYSRAISEYMKVKKKTSVARNNLQAFLSFGLKCRSKISSKKGSIEYGALGETVKENGNGEASNRGKDNSALAGPSSKEVSGCGTTSLSGEGDKRDCRIGENGDIDLNSSEKPMIHQNSTPKTKCKEKESRVSLMSSHPRRPHKRKPQNTSLAIPSLRRKALPWTKVEEDVLKEGVQRFARDDRKGIPWKEILDFGRDVFEKGRTTIDLKDKWRNICKGSPNPKKRKL